VIYTDYEDGFQQSFTATLYDSQQLVPMDSTMLACFELLLTSSPITKSFVS
jgi:hypothetical protein